MPFILEVEEPCRIVEGLFSPSRDDRLYPWKCHPLGYGRNPLILSLGEPRRLARSASCR
jgi:hypothetical protein